MRCVRLAIKSVSNLRTVDGEALNDYAYESIVQQRIPMPLIFTIEQGGKGYGIDMKLQLEDEDMQPVRLDAEGGGDHVEIVVRTRVVYAGTDKEVPNIVRMLPHSNRKLQKDGSAVISARLTELSSRGEHRGRCFQLVMYPELNDAAVTYLQRHVACDFFGEVLTHPIRVMSKCIYIPKSRQRAQQTAELPQSMAKPNSVNSEPLPGLTQAADEKNTTSNPPEMLSSHSNEKTIETENILRSEDNSTANPSQSQVTDAADVSSRSGSDESSDSDTEDIASALMNEVSTLANELRQLEEEYGTSLERLELEKLRHEALTHNLAYLRASLPYFLRQYTYGSSHSYREGEQR